jgi:8-oxo-dGTP pyrophosphatase MutT (NUDIX family)
MPSNSGYIRHFLACNRHDLGHFVPFYIGDKRYGRIKKDIVAFFMKKSKLFEPQGDGIALASRFTNFTGRSEALMQATHILAKHFDKALRNEMYPVIEKWGDFPVAQVDRVAVPWMGVRAWGLHDNGFVRKKDGPYLWIGERAADRQIDPGKLDNMIGGGQPMGLTLEQNLCKEAKEEAGIDAPLALTAKLVRTMDYMLELPNGLRADTLFIYDLELPESFTPHNTDGEVAAFYLKPLSEVAEIVRHTDKFKFNCNMVIADFLMRHGSIETQDAEYGKLSEWSEKTLFLTHKPYYPTLSAALTD